MRAANLANLKPWKPGTSGNPNGRPNLPPELRNIPCLNNAEINRRVARFARMDRATLKAFIENPKAEMLDVCIASIFAQSAKNGDYQRLAFLLDRACGRIPVTIEKELIDVTADTIEAELTVEQRDAEIDQLLALRDSLGKD